MMDLIPKKEQKPIFSQIFFSIVSVALFLAVVAAFFVFQQLVANANEVLQVLEQRFAQDTRPVEEELSARLQADKKKTEILRTVLDERKSILAFFKMLEQTSHPNVVFREFAGDMSTRVFALDGVAQNFAVLEQQRLVWEKQKEFRAVLHDITLDKEGKSAFSVEFILKPEVLDSP